MVAGNEVDLLWGKKSHDKGRQRLCLRSCRMNALLQLLPFLTRESLKPLSSLIG